MLILFDLDDTLLTSDKKITEFTKKTLLKLQALGHKIVINSARTYEFSKEYASILNADYNITDGGAVIYKNDEILFKSLLSIDLTRAIVNDILSNDKINHFSVQSLKYLYTKDVSYLEKNTFARYTDFSNIDYEATKIVINTTSDEALKLAKKYNLTLCNYLGGTWFRLNLETKKTGLDNLIKITGENNTISFGDDYGDLEFLKASTLGVCLKDSILANEGLITNVTEFDHNNDGCAKYLLNLIKSGVIK